MTKRILLVNYRKPYPLYMSGADLSNQVLLKHLKQNGYETETLFCSGPFSLDQLATELESFSCVSTQTTDMLTFTWENLQIRIATPDHFFQAYDQLCRTFKPQVIMMHNPYFDVDITKLFPYPSCHYVGFIRSPNGLDALQPVKDRFSCVFTVCQFMADAIQEKWKLPAHIIYSIPEKSFCVSDLPREQRRFITAFNPVKAKGGEMLKHVIEHFPDRQFLIVEGWVDPRYDDLHFYRYPNVTYLKPRSNVSEIYGVSRLILLPSLWRETLPRVLWEALFNEVPVLVSRQGGVEEAVKNTGLLIDDYTYLQSWIDGIEKMDNDVVYKNMVYACSQLKNSVSIEKEIKKFIFFLDPLFSSGETDL